MKRLQQQEVNKITINMDSELEALVKAFVENAMRKGYSSTKICEITREICREYREQMFPKPVILLEPESSDEEDFRSKAEKVLERNAFSGDTFYMSGERNVLLELMCAMYKVFKSDIEKPIPKDVLRLAKKRLDVTYNELDRGCREIRKISRKMKSHFSGSDLREFMSQYWYRQNSFSECILIIVWYVNNR